MEAPQVVLPGELNIFLYCVLSSAPCRPVREGKVIDAFLYSICNLKFEIFPDLPIIFLLSPHLYFGG
jgi:hypothetical protein